MSEIVPGSTLKPYDTVGTVLQYARVFTGDAARGLDGDLLSSAQPYTVALLNSAWRRLQDDLIDGGVETLIKEAIISSIPPVFSTDPSVSTFLTWDGYCDGQQLFPNPNLPNDMVIPSCLWERPSGSNGSFDELKACDGGLPTGYPGASIGYWEWRDDKIFMKGATQVTDLKMRYVTYYPDLDIADITQVPVMRSARALGYLIAAEFSAGRGAVAAPQMEANAQREISRMTNRTSRRKAIVQYRRQAFGR
jgi:hypothetical protein